MGKKPLDKIADEDVQQLKATMQTSRRRPPTMR